MIHKMFEIRRSTPSLSRLQNKRNPRPRGQGLSQELAPFIQERALFTFTHHHVKEQGLYGVDGGRQRSGGFEAGEALAFAFEMGF